MNKEAFLSDFCKAAEDSGYSFEDTVKLAGEEDPGYLKRVWAAATMPAALTAKRPLTVTGAAAPGYALNAAGLGPLGGMPARALVEYRLNNDAEKIINEEPTPWKDTLLRSLAAGGISAGATFAGSQFAPQQIKDMAPVLAAITGTSGAAVPIIARLLASTANKKAQQRAAKLVQKHPIANMMPGSSLINAAYA